MARRSRTLMQRAGLAGVVAAVLIGPATEAFAAPCGNGPAGLRQMAARLQAGSRRARHLATQVVAEALDGVSYDPAVIAKDRGQSVFAQNFLQFSDRMVNGNRLSGRSERC